MTTGFLYGPARGELTLSVDRLRAALLFFDRLVVKMEQPAFSNAADRAPESIGWLADQQLLATISASEFMTPELVQFQTAIMRSFALDAGTADWSWVEDVVLHSRFPAAPLSGTNPDERTVYLQSETAELLYAAGHLLIPGRPLPPNISVRPDVRRVIEAELAALLHSADVPSKRVDTRFIWLMRVLPRTRWTREVPRMGDYARNRILKNSPLIASDTSSPLVILHPDLAALHESVIQMAAPMVSHGRDEEWIPFSGNDSWRRYNSEGDVVFRRAMESTDSRVGRLINCEFEYLSVDLSGRSFADIIEFRDNYRTQLDDYLAGLQAAVANESLASPDEFENLRLHRALMLNDAAAQVRAASIRRFGVRALGAGVGGVGFAWLLSKGDVPTAAATIAGGVATFMSAPEVDPRLRYAYLLKLSR